jgi:hypothetical protein
MRCDGRQICQQHPRGQTRRRVWFCAAKYVSQPREPRKQELNLRFGSLLDSSSTRAVEWEALQ